jgi:CRP-like cAMP-binding protein
MATSDEVGVRAPVNPLIAKLETVSPLSEIDRDALRRLCSVVREVPARRDIIGDGDRPESVHVMLGGWAARYKVLPDGSRQITAFLIPGDFCDLHVTTLREMDHGILALTPATVAFIPHQVMQDLPLDRPELARALWWATLVDEAVLRNWIVNIGRRDAYQGVAHLMCELHARMGSVGLVDEGRFSLPLTQEELADALGLTPVHVNRVLQRLRGEGLITLEDRVLTLEDPEGLRRAAGFDPTYLHARRQGSV